ncbi:hypothetical protein C477_22065 [Haloterrigena salina JCM 13891]|uniref:Uncharacterized protein n=1 Tax=Haloterrigena salina JCM 13891 TaxID=1227488 RepID=M0BU45_9EURY|nr:hypothetical protein C477_22065 [Haloterrigena salina JCM 13891]
MGLGVIVREGSASLLEDSKGLVRPVETERLDERTYRMYFHTRDIRWPSRESWGVTQRRFRRVSAP